MVNGEFHGMTMGFTRPGNECYKKLLKMAMEIVDLHIKNGDFP
jgi:hypothetical protein